jgi:hypothetical protein
MIVLSVWISVLALFMRQRALRQLLLRRLYYYTDTLLVLGQKSSAAAW